MTTKKSTKRIALLTALVLITSLFLGISVARYVTNVGSEDEARVAIWGIEGETGNRSWLEVPLLPMNIQPAEICKIFFIIKLFLRFPITIFFSIMFSFYNMFITIRTNSLFSNISQI